MVGTLDFGILETIDEQQREEAEAAWRKDWASSAAEIERQRRLEGLMEAAVDGDNGGGGGGGGSGGGGDNGGGGGGDTGSANIDGASGAGASDGFSHGSGDPFGILAGNSARVAVGAATFSSIRHAAAIAAARTAKMLQRMLHREVTGVAHRLDVRTAEVQPVREQIMRSVEGLAQQVEAMHGRGLKHTLNNRFDSTPSAQQQQHQQQQQQQQQLEVEEAGAIASAGASAVRVQCYGSCSTGMALPSSDLDLVVSFGTGSGGGTRDSTRAGSTGGSSWSSPHYQLRQMAHALKHSSLPWVQQVLLVEATAVPVIKVMAIAEKVVQEIEAGSGGDVGSACSSGSRGGSTGTIRLDITVDCEGHSGLATAKYVRETLLVECPLLRPVALIIKQLLHEKGMDDPYRGGLSSHALTVLISFRIAKSQPANLGDALLDVLHFFAVEFNASTHGISLRNGGACYPLNPLLYAQPNGVLAQGANNGANNSCSRTVAVGSADVKNDALHNAPFLQPPQIAQWPLVIEDPLVPANNLGRTCFRVFQVQHAFGEAYDVVKRVGEAFMEDGAFAADGSIQEEVLEVIDEHVPLQRGLLARIIAVEF
jgi:hypothetical protein